MMKFLKDFNPLFMVTLDIQDSSGSWAKMASLGLGYCTLLSTFYPLSWVMRFLVSSCTLLIERMLGLNPKSTLPIQWMVFLTSNFDSIINPSSSDFLVTIRFFCLRRFPIVFYVNWIYHNFRRICYDNPHCSPNTFCLTKTKKHLVRSVASGSLKVSDKWSIINRYIWTTMSSLFNQFRSIFIKKESCQYLTGLNEFAMMQGAIR